MSPPSRTFPPLRRLIAGLALAAAFAPGLSAGETVNLAGDWRFSLDRRDEGLGARWFERHDFPDTIPLPGTTDIAGFGDVPAVPEERILTRAHRYFGAAWYSREIIVPEASAGKNFTLFLERVIFESRAWIDGKPAGTQDSLVAPHVHSLGKLAPGKHTLTVRIDNRMVQPIGVDGHGFTETTQTIWNGAIGKIELRADDPVALGLLRVFTDPAKRTVTLEAGVTNTTGANRPGTLRLRLRERGSETIVAESESAVTAAPGESTLKKILPLGFAPKLWDEFSPALYTLEATLATGDTSDTKSAEFGFRVLSRDGMHIAINGRKTFMRGNMDHSIFPLTGHPPADVAGWKRVFQIYKDYGMNQVRFHSWTPPEAAFQAADELGLYLQPEIFWYQYALGSGKPLGDVKRLGRGNLPESYFHADGSPDAFVRAEMRRVTDTYGNHPSFVLFAIGNELTPSVWSVTGGWIREEKEHDPRRLYAASTARKITPEDDFADTHNVPGVGSVRDRIEPRNDWDYEEKYAKSPVPTLAHELGQWPTYPLWSEIEKYTGVLRAPNLEKFRDIAKAHGVSDQNEDFHRASGALAVRLYKDQMESHLRTPSCQGYSTLGMQDYPGQGEALVGWLDAFLDSKGTVTPERFRRWNSETVPLARLPKYVFSCDEPVTGTAELANYAATDFAPEKTGWRLLDRSGRMIDEGAFHGPVARTGEVTKLADFSIPTGKVKPPAQVRLELYAESRGVRHANDWDIWVYPKENAAEVPAGVTLTDSLPAAEAALARGERVLLDASKLGGKRNASLARFRPVYWSAVYFPGMETLGALIRNGHPALAGFPTEDHYDWQWYDLCNTGRGFPMDALPASFRPIVQPVPDFHSSNRFGTLFELKAEAGGRLLVCGYDIGKNLAARPAAARLRESLLRYVAGPDFNPAQAVTGAQLEAILGGADAGKPKTPSGLPGAVLDIVAGGAAPAGTTPWTPGADTIAVRDEGFSYTVRNATVVKDAHGAGWVGRNPEFTIKVTKISTFDLLVNFTDPTGTGVTGTITFEGLPYKLGKQSGAKGTRMKFDVLREDGLDGELVLKAHSDSGADLRITGITLVPKQL